MPQPLAEPVRSERRYRAYWAPAGWVAATVTIDLVFNPIWQGDHFGELVSLLLIGVVFCQPLLTALWGAWAPLPLKWRGPLGLVATVLLALAIMASDGDMVVSVVYAGLFAIFWCGLTLLRRYGGWRLKLKEEAVTTRGDRKSFSIAYLLIWTTVLIAFLVVGQQLTYDTSGLESFGNGPFGQAIWIATMLLTYTFLLSPILASALIVLGDKPRFAIGLLLVPATIATTSALAVLLTLWFQPQGPSIYEGWKDLFTASSGASIYSALFGLVLRWAGHRVTRD